MPIEAFKHYDSMITIKCGRSGADVVKRAGLTQRGADADAGADYRSYVLALTPRRMSTCPVTFTLYIVRSPKLPFEFFFISINRKSFTINILLC